MRHAVFATALLLGVNAACAQQAPALPDGPGRDAVAVACVQCHSLTPITQLRMSEDAWRRQVGNMVLRGAQIGPNEIDTVASYLADKFGPGVPFPNQTAAPVRLADGPGANLVEGGCGLCHGLDRVVNLKRPPEQWPTIVHHMVAIGAPLDKDQADQAIKYLQATYAAKP